MIHYLKNPAIQLKLYLRNIRFGGPILWPCILLGASPALMQLTENMVAISFITLEQKISTGVKKTFRLLLISCVSSSFLIWLICMISLTAVSSIFTNDMDLIAYTNKSMRVYLAMLLIYGIQVACQYSFVALDQAPKAIFLTIWRKIIILIPLIFLLPHFISDAAMGVYLAEPIADTITVCTTGPMFYVYYRKLE